MIVTDARGLIRYSNDAARAVMADHHARRAGIGEPIDEVLEPEVRAAAARDPGPGGWTTWYLGVPGRLQMEAARFEIEVADALAGSLNLRRTLARIADLAVPALGSWTGVTLLDPVEVRQVARSGAGPVEDRTRAATAVPDDVRGRLRRAVDAGVETVSLTAEDVVALGATRPAAEALCAGGPVPALTVALRAHGSVVGLLAVAGADGAAPDRDPVCTLARRAAVALSAARVYEERSALASTLRAALLPAELPAVPGVLVGSAYRPAQEATEIGGDFFEVRPDGAGWCLSIGDVCGKGIDAAVLTGQVRQSLRTVSLVDDTPERRLRRLNEALLATDGTSFVTVLHATLRPDPAGGVDVRIAGGGHPAPLLRHRDGTVEEVAVTGPIIGMLPEVSFRPVELTLAPGESLVCFTDGLPDARGDSGRLGTGPLAAVLADSEGMVAQAIAERLLQTALEHLDGRPHDDIAILAVQADGGRGAK